MGNEIVKEFYKNRIDLYGLTSRVVWDNVESQRLRFKILTEIGDLNGKSVLDVGCGFGDFYEFLAESHINVLKYSGIDLVEDMIKEARKRHFLPDFEVFDILKHNVKKFDYVFGSGIFNVSFDGWIDHTYIMLKKMFYACNIGIAVNFLSWYAENLSPKCHYVHPSLILGVAFDLSSKVVFRHDYKINDFTLYIYR